MARQSGGISFTPQWNYTGTSYQFYNSLDNSYNFVQSLLVSGTNIKTVNGNSLLGSGNIVIGGGGGSGTTTNVITFNDSGSGAISGSVFDGSVPQTISYNTIGAISPTSTNPLTNKTFPTTPTANDMPLRYQELQTLNTSIATKQNKIPTIIYADDYTDAIAPGWTYFIVNTSSAIVQAINAAHVLGGGTIILSNKTYVPTGYSVLNQMTYDNIAIIGEKSAEYANDCRSLTGGTIIQGQISVWANNFTLQNVGLDAGKTVSDTYFSSTALEAFAFTNPSPPASGEVKTNVRFKGFIRTLNVGGTTAHSLLIENANGVVIDDVETLYGSFATVIKSQNVYAQNIIANGHQITIKSDIINNNAKAGNITIENILHRTIPPNTTPYYTPSLGVVGIEIDAAGRDLENVTINNISVLDQTSTAINITPRSSGTIAGLNLGNVLIQSAGRGIYLNGTDAAKNVKIKSYHAVSVGYPYQDATGSGTTGNHINSMTVDNATQAAVILGGVTGVAIDHLQINTAPAAFNLASGANAQVLNYIPYSVTALNLGTGRLTFNSELQTVNTGVSIQQSAAPQNILKNTAAASDMKVWDVVTDAAGFLNYRAVNDANSVANIWMQVSRTGYTPTGVKINYPFTLAALSGSGNRITYVDASGLVQTAVIGSGLSLSEGTLTANGISGSGTAGYISKWTGAGAQGNSVLQEGTNTMSMNVGADNPILFSKNTSYNTFSLNNSSAVNAIGLIGGATGDPNLYVNAGASGDVVIRNNTSTEIGRFKAGALLIQGVAVSIRNITTTTTITNNDYTLLVTGGATFMQGLPNTPNIGQIYYIVNSGTGVVTVTASNGIMGAGASSIINAGQTGRYQYTGTSGFYIIL